MGCLLSDAGVVVLIGYTILNNRLNQDSFKNNVFSIYGGNNTQNNLMIKTVTHQKEKSDDEMGC